MKASLFAISCLRPVVRGSANAKSGARSGRDVAPLPTVELNGGPCRDRTYDQEIKSHLLYQLS